MVFIFFWFQDSNYLHNRIFYFLHFACTQEWSYIYVVIQNFKDIEEQFFFLQTFMVLKPVFYYKWYIYLWFQIPEFFYFFLTIRLLIGVSSTRFFFLVGNIRLLVEEFEVRNQQGGEFWRFFTSINASILNLASWYQW